MNSNNIPSNSLEELKKLIENSIHETSKLNFYENNETTNYTKEEFKQKLNELKKLVDNYDSRALSELKNLNLPSDSESIKNDFTTLKKHIEVYDFEKGSDILKSITKKISNNL